MKNISYLFFILPFFAEAQFTELAPMPESVSNNAVVAAEASGNQFVYSFTGIDSTKIWSGTHLKSWRYDVSADEWISLLDVPDSNGGKIAAWASEVNGKIYLIGGYHVAQNGGEISSDKVHVFDPISNDWLADAAPVPVPIDDQVQAVWRDSLIYVVTGWSNNGNVTNVQIFNPTDNIWTVGTPVPNQSNYRVFGASGVIVEDTIYYAGGARFAGNFPASTYFRKGVINPNNPTEIEWTGWTEDAARGYRMAAVTSNNRAIWLGGSDVTYNYNGIAYNNSGGVPPLDRITVYQPDENTFYQNGGSMPAVMDLRGLGHIAENQVIIAGGMEANQEVSNRTWLINLDNITGIEDNISTEKNYKVYPNPTSDYINIEAYGNFEFEVIDINGKLIQRGTGFEKKQLNVEAWHCGNYWLEIIFENGLRGIELIMIK